MAFITVYKLLPETKGKSLEQIEAEWGGQTTFDRAEEGEEVASDMAKMIHP